LTHSNRLGTEHPRKAGVGQGVGWVGLPRCYRGITSTDRKEVYTAGKPPSRNLAAAMSSRERRTADGRQLEAQSPSVAGHQASWRSGKNAEGQETSLLAFL